MSFDFVSLNNESYICIHDILLQQPSVPSEMLSHPYTTTLGRIMKYNNINDIINVPDVLTNKQFRYQMTNVYSNGLNKDASIQLDTKSTWSKLFFNTTMDSINKDYNKLFKVTSKLKTTILTKGYNNNLTLYCDTIWIPHTQHQQQYRNSINFTKTPDNPVTILYKIPTQYKKYAIQVTNTDKLYAFVDLINDKELSKVVLPTSRQQLANLDNIIILQS